MNRPARIAYSTALSIAACSLLVAACAELAEMTGAEATQPPPAVDVQNLYRVAPAGMPVGVAVPAGRGRTSLLRSPERQAVVNQHFNQLSAENIMKPNYLHPEEDRYFFDDADALVAYAASHDMSVHGHTLVWHVQPPAWMTEFSGSARAWRKMMSDHITAIVSHYAAADIVVSWDVINEVFTDSDADGDGKNDMRSTIWYDNIGRGYLATAFRVARAADPNAELYYNDYNISGERTKLNAVLDMVRQFQSDPDPVPIDGIGFQMHIYYDWPEIAQIREAFTRVVATGLKVKITELDITVNTDRRWRPGPAKSFTPRISRRQYERYEAVIGAYMETVPPAQRGGISVWGIADIDTWRRSHSPNEWPLLFDDNFAPKPALQGFADGLKRGR